MSYIKQLIDEIICLIEKGSTDEEIMEITGCSLIDISNVRKLTEDLDECTSG